MAYNKNRNKKTGGGTLTIVKIEGVEYARKGNKLHPVPRTSGANNQKKKKKKSYHYGF